MKIKLIAIATTSLLLISWLSVSCGSSQNINSRLSLIIKPYRFSIVQWELNTISHEVNQLMFNRSEEFDDETGVVTEYFAFVERIKTLKAEIQQINTGDSEVDSVSLEAELNMVQEQGVALKNTAEKIMERQIRETLAQQDIFNPIDKYIKLRITFPPVNFTLDTLPYLLVISPRQRIESMREILLRPDLSREEMDDIELEVDKLGVSSLVVRLGGLGTTYPTFVTNEASLWFTIDTAIEEWLHQYLVFKPLGFLYLLDLTGLSRNYEIATINETLVGMVSREIGAIVRETYYSEYGNNDNQTVESEFDFNREMREIRKAVDKYLVQGKIERAEEYMEQKRQYLTLRGRYIRKLNQAYFAWYGTYADSPTSINPIGLELKELRSQSDSLRGFLDTIALMTSRQELRANINAADAIQESGK